jgi:ABC-type transporter Mla MlaB component
MTINGNLKIRDLGVMAHELQEVVPQAAFGEKDSERMQGVDYSTLVPILIQAIKEQQTQIEELKILINK